MQQVIRRKVVVESDGLIKLRAAGLPEGTRAEVLIIVEEKSVHTPSAKGYRSRPPRIHCGLCGELFRDGFRFGYALEAAGVEFLTNEARGTRL